MPFGGWPAGAPTIRIDCLQGSPWHGRRGAQAGRGRAALLLLPWQTSKVGVGGVLGFDHREMTVAPLRPFLHADPFVGHAKMDGEPLSGGVWGSNSPFRSVSVHFCTVEQGFIMQKWTEPLWFTGTPATQPLSHWLSVGWDRPQTPRGNRMRRSSRERTCPSVPLPSPAPPISGVLVGVVVHQDPVVPGVRRAYQQQEAAAAVLRSHAGG